MNVSAKSKTRIPWRRIIPIGLVLLVAGYSYSRPTLERWFNISLPAVNENGGRHNQNNHSPNSGNGGNYEASLPKDFKISTTGSFKLKEVGNKRYETPAGLLYTPGSKEGHRITHVMRHAHDIPDRRGSHGVFTVNDQDDVLKLIDEAYELVKSNSPRVKREPPRDKNPNNAYDIDMKRKIGFEGGQNGKKNNNRSLNKIKLILNDNRVITAYPAR